MRRQNRPCVALDPTVTQQFVGVAPDIIVMIGVTRPSLLFCQTARTTGTQPTSATRDWLQCGLPCEPLVTDASQPRIVYAHPRRVQAIEGDKPARCRAMRASSSLWRLDDRDEFYGELLRSTFRVALGGAYPLAGQPYGLSSRSRSVYSCSSPNHGYMYR